MHFCAKRKVADSWGGVGQNKRNTLLYSTAAENVNMFLRILFLFPKEAFLCLILTNYISA